ncbi:hypothetical protein BS78_06G274400 [Paspalum vaginatum]|nr:hypothetical protein BS78_06G274400 [Paspalum vaginatum]KAJ1273365.1 hypothetical protein BS78_06G274400 [Paspalum vaginatum]
MTTPAEDQGLLAPLGSRKHVAIVMGGGFVKSFRYSIAARSVGITSLEWRGEAMAISNLSCHVISFSVSELVGWSGDAAVTLSSPCYQRYRLFSACSGLVLSALAFVHPMFDTYSTASARTVISLGCTYQQAAAGDI